MVGVMTHAHGRAQLAQPLHIGVFRQIAALNAIAEIDQNFGQPAHPNAADADEMNGVDWEGKGTDGARGRARRRVRVADRCGRGVGLAHSRHPSSA